MTQNMSTPRESKSSGHFSELLKVSWRLSLREPLGIGMGLAFPIALLLLFGFISKAEPGVDGLSIIQLYIPTIIVITLLSIGLYSIPVTIVRDREIGWLRRVSATPVSPARLLAAQVVINIIIAVVGIAIVLIGGVYVFGASLHVGVLYFSISLVLATWIMISLGLLVAAFASTQRVATGFVAALFYPLLFLSGLWVQPSEVGNPLRSIMWYSPVGAAARSLLYSIFNTTPPYMELVAMLVYAAIFSFIAVRYFKWE